MSLSNKKDFANLLKKLTKPLLKYYSKNDTQLKWGSRKVVYNQHIVGIEGFSRVLWGYSSLFTDTDEFTNNPTTKAFWFKTINGLINATSTNNTKYNWEKPENYNQIYVEMCSIAVFILFNKDKLKKELSHSQISDLCTYLNRINDFEFSKNNWQFFRVMVNIALLSLNSEFYNENKMLESLETINKCYIKDGWYYDGRANQKDYYIAWGYHYYGLIFNYFVKDKFPKWANLFLNRAIEFYDSYKYFFNSKGCQIRYGRSLIYRFAVSSYFSALALNNIYPNGIEELKWFITKNISYFTNNKNNFDSEGKLNLGFDKKDHTFLEEYNSNTSPYWTLKTFIILALNKNNEFWKASIKEPKWDNIKKIDALKSIIINTKTNEKYLINPGQYAVFNPKYNQEKYTKEIYKTSSEFKVYSKNLSNDLELFISKDNINFSTKKLPQTINLINDSVVSEHEIEQVIIKTTKWFEQKSNTIFIKYEFLNIENDIYISIKLKNKTYIKKTINKENNSILIPYKI
ncbi:DUF2264 domain-containing protein [Mycoplasmopsis alligatoris]|uniref:DUF2264 domain-containing protein n=1 Tax=Mycoplasmopsis alligatoris A21JP2 TaxID=747682 RepID=D4XUV4_9BACT|nr:DUF2264 domain-containing protein [Mycoplasmopsis alligatoris]EFF41803.1 hypothetical protein MALL_0108 [Mycoplasmopsis alligatoris A21JP2]